MNQHIATYPESGDLKMIWLTAQPSVVDKDAYEAAGLPLPRTSKLELSFRRTAIGMSFNPLFVVAVGERHFEHLGKSSTMYIVLDESLDTEIPSQTIASAIELKDRYRANLLFCPMDGLIEAVKAQEGLTRYLDPQIKQMAIARWPSFVDFEQTVSVRPKEVPQIEEMSSQINTVLSDHTIDPQTEKPMRGADGDPIPRILFLDDFPTFRTMQSIRTNTLAGTTALWMAVTGLEQTGVPPPIPVEPPPSRRNPTGY